MFFKMPLLSLSANSGVSATDLLSQLPPLALPTAVSWWPIAIGWWLLTVLILSIIALSVFLFKRHRKMTYYIKLSRRKLSDIYQEYDKTKDKTLYLNHCNQLIRSFCHHQYPHKNLSVLTGKQWLTELDCIVKKTLLNTVQGQQLLGHYQKNHQTDIKQLHALLEQWFNAVPKKINTSSVQEDNTHAA